MVDVGPASASNSGSSQNNSNGEEDKKDERMFECNICLDTAKDAVVSMCGHLFCWPCLHQWLETRPARQMCPVCKAAISKEKVIPLYGRGSSKQEDPRNKAPPRPAGQRSEPEANTTEEGQWWDSNEEGSSNGSEFSDSVVETALSFVFDNYDWDSESLSVDENSVASDSNDVNEEDWLVDTESVDTMSEDDFLDAEERSDAVGSHDWQAAAVGFEVSEFASSGSESSNSSEDTCLVDDDDISSYIESSDED